MSDARGRFIDGFGEAEQIGEDEDPVYAQLDALAAERRECGDPSWFPPGPDPDGLERLVRERGAGRV